MENAAVEVHITPVNVAADMMMRREYVADHLKEKDDLRRILYDGWIGHIDGGYNDRLIWDLVAVQSLLHPEWLEEVEIQTPSENLQRKIFVTKSIDADKMSVDFFETMLDYFK